MKLDLKEIIRLGLILLLICALSAMLLAFTNAMTIDKIMEQRALASERDRKATLPKAQKFEPLEEGVMKSLKEKFPLLKEVYMGYDQQDAVLGYVIKTTPGGYGGPIEISTGINSDGTIGGVRMGSSHQETPGLGAKAETPEFYGQYEGLVGVEGLNVVKAAPKESEILAISGATITSKAVTDGVNIAGDVFKALEAEGAGE